MIPKETRPMLGSDLCRKLEYVSPRALVSVLRFTLILTTMTCLALPTASADQYYNSAEPGCDGTDSTVLYCDDLEDGSWAETDADTNGGRFNPDNDGWGMNIFTSWPDPQGTGWARCGNKGAAGTSCAGTSKTLNPSGGSSSGMSGYHWFAPNTTQYEELYFRYYLKQLPGFIMGHEKTLTLQNEYGFQACLMSKMFGSGKLANYIPREDAIRYQNQGNDMVLANNKWYYIEVHLKLNTPGSSDGVYELWMDDCGTDGLGCTGPGTLRSRHTDVNYRGSSGDKIEVTWFENWGNAGSTGEQYYDQFYTATRRVGPMSVGGASTMAPPTAVRIQAVTGG